MNATPATATALSLRLREETHAPHARVERATEFNRLVVVRVPAPDEAAEAAERAARERALADYREVYRLFLLASYGFEAAVLAHLAASPALAAARAAGWADEDPTSTALLRDDLATVFGLPHDAPLAHMEGLPPAGSLAAFAGIEYVRRGSRAGGAVIGAVVAHNLRLTRERGASFVLRHGRETKRHLQALRDWLDALPLAEPGRREAVRAAAATFAAVERWHRRLERRAGRD